jgi:sulfur-carrier protein
MILRISGTLLRFTDYQKELRFEAATLKDGIDQLAQQYPEVGKALLDKQGNIRASHRLFINGDAVERNDMGRAMAGEDIVDILTAVTGG